MGQGDDTLAMVTLNRNLYETVLRELLLEGAEHSVELWEEERGGWKRTRVASPGKLGAFEEELYRAGDVGDAPVVVACKTFQRDGQRMVGLAYANSTTREMGACDFADDDNFRWGGVAHKP